MLPGASLEELAARKKLSRDMIRSLREISEFRGKARELTGFKARPDEYGHEKLELDLNPSNLAWVQDPAALSRLGLKRPSFLFYELTPLHFHDTGEFDRILRSAANQR